MIYAVVDKTKKQQDVSRPIHCHLILGVHTYTFVGIIITKTELFVHLAWQSMYIRSYLSMLYHINFYV